MRWIGPPSNVSEFRQCGPHEFNRPYGTERELGDPVPGDESPGYFQIDPPVEIHA